MTSIDRLPIRWVLAASLIGSLLAVTAPVAAAGETSNTTVGRFSFDIQTDEFAQVVDEVSFDVTVDVDLPPAAASQNHAIGGIVPVVGEAIVFAGFESLAGERWATLVVRYEDEADYSASSAQFVGGGRDFANTDERERRVAIRFDWEEGVDYRFSVARVAVAGGTEWSASFQVGDGGPQSIGTQLSSFEATIEVDDVYSIVQRTDFQTCSDAFDLTVRIGGVTGRSATESLEGRLVSAYVEDGSCERSAVADGLNDVLVHSLSGIGAFLDGLLGVGLAMPTEDFLVGDTADPAYPYCLANIADEATKRVCFLTDTDREAMIAAIVSAEAQPRPSGETIWIGRFDEEVVAP